MKRVVAYNRFYRPHFAPTGLLLGDVCDALQQAGFDVEVCASKTKYGTAPELGKKLLAQFWYSAKVIAFGLRQPRGTIAIAAADPPYLGILVSIIGRLKGHRVVLWLQDRYPALAVEFGFIRKHGILHRVWTWLDRWAREHAAAVVAIGPMMAEDAGGDVHVIHNWVDTQRIKPLPNSNDHVVFLYAGNAGRAHDMSALVEAIKANPPGVVFRFVGNGYRIDELRRLKLPNVEFGDYVPVEKLPELLSSGDVGVVTESEGVKGLLLPSKLYGILAAGRPVLYVGPNGSDAARIIEKHNAGVVCRENVLAAIERLKDRAVREKLGGNGREAATAEYDRSVAMRQWLSLIQSL